MHLPNDQFQSEEIRGVLAVAYLTNRSLAWFTSDPSPTLCWTLISLELLKLPISQMTPLRNTPLMRRDETAHSLTAECERWWKQQVMEKHRRSNGVTNAPEHSQKITNTNLKIFTESSFIAGERGSRKVLIQTASGTKAHTHPCTHTHARTHRLHYWCISAWMFRFTEFLLVLSTRWICYWIEINSKVKQELFWHFLIYSPPADISR